jgi:PPP family 3-phenylpropionic acid transporter
MSERRETAGYAARLSLFYGALFWVAGTKLPYLPLWLDWRGLTPFQIALIASAPLFVRVVATPFMAMKADRTGARTRVVELLAWLALIATAALPFAHGFWLILALALALAFASTAMMPLTETLAMAGVRERGLDYGRMRLWGSLSFIAASFGAGATVERWGADAVVWVLLVGAVATVVAARFLPQSAASTIPASDIGSDAAPVSIVPSAVSIFLSRPFLLFLLAAGAVQATHATFYTFGVIHWRATGLSSTIAGMLWGIGVIAEIVLFAYSGAVVSRIGARELIAIAGLAAVFRWTMMAFDPPLALLVPLQVLHGLTFGAAHLGAMHYIAKTVPSRYAATGQALYSSVTAGIAMGLATLAAGPLYASFQAKSYLAMALIGALGLAAALMLQRPQPESVR